MFSSAVRMRQQHRLAVFIQSLQNAKIKACLIWTNGRFVFHAICSHAGINMKAQTTIALPMWSQYLTDINNCNLLETFGRLPGQLLQATGEGASLTLSLSVKNHYSYITLHCWLIWLSCFLPFEHCVREFIKIWKPTLKAILLLLTKNFKRKEKHSWGGSLASTDLVHRRRQIFGFCYKSEAFVCHCFTRVIAWSFVKRN